MIPGPARFRQSPAVLSRTVGDEVILALAEREDFTCLAGSGRAIWEVMDAPRTLPDMVSILSDAYAVEEGVLARDVEQLLDELLEQRLVEQVADGDV